MFWSAATVSDGADDARRTAAFNPPNEADRVEVGLDGEGVEPRPIWEQAAGKVRTDCCAEFFLRESGRFRGQDGEDCLPDGSVACLNTRACCEITASRRSHPLRLF